METVAVIGAGLMGHGIAQVFAAHGHVVWVQDVVDEALTSVRDRVRTNLARMAEYGLANATEIPAILDRIAVTPDLPTACAHADIVIEAVSENPVVKQQLFEELARVCPEQVILCSNTSAISITQIGERASHRKRVLGTHFFYPPYLIPLVEVTRTQLTAPACVDIVCGILCNVGKVPVRVQKDVPGFIANRMQHALWREAFAIIEEGICDAETVDVAVRKSFGLRMPVLGPAVNADMIGLDLTLAIQEYLLPHLNASPTPSTVLRAKVERNELGFKTGRGFFTWTEDSIAAARNQLITYLLESLSHTATYKKSG